LLNVAVSSPPPLEIRSKPSHLGVNTSSHKDHHTGTSFHHCTGHCSNKVMDTHALSCVLPPSCVEGNLTNSNCLIIIVSIITPQRQKRNTGHQHIRNVSNHLHSRNHRLEQERNTESRQNDKEDNEHARRTSPKSRHSQVVHSKKEGGRELREVAATVRFQCAGLQVYISKTKEKDYLVEAVWKHQAIKEYKSGKDIME